MSSENNQVRILDPQLTTLTTYAPAEGSIAPSGAGATGKSLAEMVLGDSAKHPNATLGDGVIPQSQTAHNRRDTLGASEIAAVLGLDPYRTSHDIYLLKTGQVDEFEGNAATKRGTILEPALIEYACNELAVNLVGVQVRVVHPSGVLSATLDAMGRDSNGTPTLIEAKTTGLTEDWGEPGTDAVPEKVLVQVHHQMLCAGPEYRVCVVPVLLISFGNAVVEWFKVQRNDRLCEIIEKAGLDFMQAVAQRRSPPTPPPLPWSRRFAASRPKLCRCMSRWSSRGWRRSRLQRRLRIRPMQPAVICWRRWVTPRLASRRRGPSPTAKRKPPSST